MNDIKHVFIMNPAAGRADSTASVASAIHAIASRRRLDCDILTTGHPRHAIELVRSKAKEYANRPVRFYACGGDGTFNEVAAGAAGLENVAVTHIPCGSGNDFVRIFGDQKEAFRDLDALVDGAPVDLDYMESDCGVCANVFSIGLDARIAKSMQKYKRIPMLGGKMAYNLSTVENLLRGLSQPYGVEVDGKRFDGRYTLVLAGNGRFYGGGAYPVPEADPTDGMLEVLLVKGVSLLTASRVIGAYMAGYHRRYPQYITHLQARSLTVFHQNGKDMTVNLDGEIVQTSRVSVRVAQKKMHFVVPRGAVLQPAQALE